METARTEGIILHSLPVKDWDLIVTAFTRDFGVVKFYYKNGQSRKRSKGAVSAPLTCAEFIFFRRNSDLVPLSDISIVDVHVDLRNSLEKLEYSCHWLQLISKSQLPGKPSPELYMLLKTYIKTLQHYSNPYALHGSFYLKLLRHEGGIEINPQCCVCHLPAAFQGGQSFCKAHSPPNSLPFSQEHFELLHQLACCRSLKEIEKASITKSFIESIKTLYERLQ